MCLHTSHLTEINMYIIVVANYYFRLYIAVIHKYLYIVRYVQ